MNTFFSIFGYIANCFANASQETMDIEIVDIDLANDIDFFHAIEMEN